ncbi:alcohol dehydrogenase catalytic domain-containing protein [Patescibacteria group bacterium]|nr:alcohol dehydrogenase catalytic domain-containing protein [Patescibacteria group bacterium]MBU1907278.1 alcohol dehydrogenase catalytic domain-containing protein [Patescibacteria group bacterium]
MKVVTLTGNGIGLLESELGALSRDWARIRVVKAGLCGSDVAKISAPSLPTWHTRILGHEFYGQIIDLNGSPEYVAIGDYVAVMPLLPCETCEACAQGQENLCAQGQAIGRTTQGAFAEIVDAPITNVFRLDDQASLEEYVLTDPLAVCLHAVNLAEMSRSKQQCLVVGDGTIGCLLAWILQEQGHTVSIKGIHKEVLNFMNGFGVNSVEIVQTRHFDVVFEAVGRSQQHSLDDSLKAAKWGGTIVVLGVFAQGYQYPLAARDLFIGEIRLVGASAYQRLEFEEALRLIRECGEKLRKFISHRFPLDRFQDALVTARSKRGFTMKIILGTGGIHHD